MSDTGKIFNIQRFSTHDGPGIRTVVFMTGCPMRCRWCSNPESQRMSGAILWDERKCIGCGLCEQSCGYAIVPGMQGIDERCIGCGACVKACPSTALERMGEDMTVERVMETVRKDKAFYEDSGGGVTISGGEPLMQAEFVLALAGEIKREGYHLAIETTGYAEWKVTERTLEPFDLILYDLKHMDTEQHNVYTGVQNDRILANARRAGERGFPLIYRVPLLGGINADLENMDALGEFAVSTGVKEIHLLPYHTYGENKYKLLRARYQCSACRPSEEEISAIRNLLEGKGRIVKIGG